MGLYGNDLFYVLLLVLLFVLQLLWLKLSRRKKDAERRSQGRTAADLSFCICVSLAVASLFHLYPGSGRLPIEDSSAFLYIGKRMLEGRLPYRDIFDHKGPILYLIQVLGLSLTPGSHTGVWVLEVLNMLMTVWLLRKLAGLTAEHDDSAYLAVLAAVGICGWKIWQGGNFTEEFALPWISLAAFVFFRFFGKNDIRQGQIILLGISFAVVLMLRANMIACWAALMPIVLIMLLREKRYADIGKCTLLFLAGMLLILVPIVVWAASAGFLTEMWQDYVLFNFTYTGNAATMAIPKHILMLRLAEVIWPGLLAALIAAVLDRCRRSQWFNLLFFAVSIFTAAMSGRLYYHYAIVVLPAAVFPFVSIFNYTGRLIRGRDRQTETGPALVILTCLLFLIGAFCYRELTSVPAGTEPLTLWLQENTKEDDDVLVLGKSLGYYIQADRKTDNRFFYQLPPLEISSTLREEFKEELLQHPSDCIVIPGDAEARDRTKEKLEDAWQTLEQLTETDYIREEYDLFEVYIKQ